MLLFWNWKIYIKIQIYIYLKYEKYLDLFVLTVRCILFVALSYGIAIVNIGPVYMVSNQYKNLHREVLKNKKK